MKGVCSVCGDTVPVTGVIPQHLREDERVDLLLVLWEIASGNAVADVRKRLGKLADAYIRRDKFIGASLFGPRADARDILGRTDRVDYIGPCSIKTVIPHDLNELDLTTFEREHGEGTGEEVVRRLFPKAIRPKACEHYHARRVDKAPRFDLSFIDVPPDTIAGTQVLCDGVNKPVRFVLKCQENR